MKNEIDKNSPKLLHDLRTLIEESRSSVATVVNATLTMLYWQIGKRINDEILKGKRAEYGKQIVSALSTQLQNEYGNGFKEKNLRRMLQFADIFTEQRIVTSLMRQLSWTHFTLLIPLRNKLQREFYAEMCRLEKWSVRTLRERIDSMLYERIALSKKPEELISNELRNLREKNQLTPNLVFKDPYILDFLELNDHYYEKDLEDAYKGQMELYLRWLAKHEQETDELLPLGIILCADKQHEQIELLELDQSGIHVAEYLTVIPQLELLQQKLHNAVEISRLRLEAKKEQGSRVKSSKIVLIMADLP